MLCRGINDGDELRRTLTDLLELTPMVQSVAAVPKSLNPERQKQNAELFSFNLTPEEMERLDNLPQACFSGLDPDHVTF